MLGLLDDEPTEADFALALDSEMRRLGASGPSFDTIVAGGPNAGLPHHRPDGRRIREGDLLVLDFGALVDGYHSDMTRTAMLGEPSAEQAELLALVTEAQARGVAAVRARRRRPRRRRRLPVVHRRRRLGRALHPRHRPRRRPAHPRGALGERHLDRRPRRRVPWSPSSPACTVARSAASGSRTPSWSWPTAAARSPPPPRICHACDHHQRPQERDDPRSSTTACSPSSSSSTSSRARAAPSCAPR